MKIKIAPSLLSADFADLTKAVRDVEAGGARYLHFDVMDGHFVPNLTFGPMVVRALRPLTDMEFVVHLMIYHPEMYFEELVKAGAGSITVHTEACPHLHRSVQHIRSAGAKPGVALNPATPLNAIEYMLADIDLILIMTVNPGFGGQKFIEAMLPKIESARAMVEKTGREIDIAVDGGIDARTCSKVVSAGANLLVAGSSIFGSQSSPAEAVRELESCAVSAAKGCRWA